MGTSTVPFTGEAFLRDHPHAYGDKVVAPTIAASSAGSSPRVWGQGPVVKHNICLYRIIPTRMGTSEIQDFVTYLKKDHPHAYGDKFVPLGQLSHIAGSSPRVWGQVNLLLQSFGDTGIIPTRMGTRRRQFLGITKYKDHPHAYGDKRLWFLRCF